jgi:hypothetical protein
MSGHISKLVLRPRHNMLPPRSTVFSRLIIGARHRLPTTNILAFLESLFGGRFTISDLRGLPAGLVHKSSGSSLHQSFHTWIVEPVLSLAVNWMLPSFGSWLSQVYRVQIASEVEKKIHTFSILQAQSTIERVLVNRFIGEGRSESYDRRCQPVWSGIITKPVVHRAAWNLGEREKSTANHVSSRQSSIYAGSISDRTIPRETAPVFALSPALTAGSILAPASWAGAAVRQFRIPVVSASALQSPLFIVPKPQAERGHPDWSQPRSGFRRGYEGRRANDFGSIGVPGSRRVFEPSTQHFAEIPTGFRAVSQVTRSLRRAGSESYRFVTGSLVADLPGMRLDRVKPSLTSLDYLESSDRQADRRVISSHRRVASYDRGGMSPNRRVTSYDKVVISYRPETLTGIEQWFGSNREFVAGTMQRYESISEDRRGSTVNEFTFLRREEQMRHPPQSYTYAQPARPTIEEEGVIKRVREKEVVEIVRKEVETIIKSRSPIDSLSRADYSRIADHVSSTLARRLLMEKERRGLHF